ncbi:hypothetical protein [Borreliella burgdorferi]|uniref:hypothetical protein n=1 Tax=Borreliella burgdorferi TaxID=139 RepID=UPI002ED894A8
MAASIGFVASSAFFPFGSSPPLSTVLAAATIDPNICSPLTLSIALVAFLISNGLAPPPISGGMTSSKTRPP